MISQLGLQFLVKMVNISHAASQPAITCSNLTIETVEQGVKYF